MHRLNIGIGRYSPRWLISENTDGSVRSLSCLACFFSFLGGRDSAEMQEVQEGACTFNLLKSSEWKCRLCVSNEDFLVSCSLHKRGINNRGKTSAIASTISQTVILNIVSVSAQNFKIGASLLFSQYPGRYPILISDIGASLVSFMLSK